MIGAGASLESLSAYMLQASSPVVDVGESLVGHGISPGSRDFYGNSLPQGAGFDMGAHERAAAGSGDTGGDTASDSGNGEVPGGDDPVGCGCGAGASPGWLAVAVVAGIGRRRRR